MSNRRRPKPRRHYGLPAFLAALVLVGGVAAAVASHSEEDGKAAVSDAADTSSGTGAQAAQGGPGPATAKATTSATARSTSTASATASATATGGPTASAKASTGAPAPTRTVPLPAHAPAVFTGKGFDTCTAPKAATMTAWRKSSPYGAAAVYIGGRNRGCAQPQLTASWVHSVSAAGWKLIPLYVGAQPPCQTSGNPERITAGNAASLGASDGADAAARASALGMRAGSAIYLDMEEYDISDTSCVASVLSYVRAWDRAAHSRGYWAGFYGFSKSSAAAVAAAAPGADLPDALWYARYDGNADTTTGFPYAGGLWTGHRRGHQYAVNLKETYGGASLTVDHDAWDGPVAVV